MTTEIKTECFYCEGKFVSQAQLNQHNCSFGVGSGYDQAGSLGPSWDQGLYSQQGFEASCLFCGKCFSSQGQLGDHECSTGGQLLRDANQNLDLMKSLYHSDRKRELEPQIEIACLYCAKKFPCQSQLNEHECCCEKQLLADKTVHSGAQEEVEVLVTCLYCCQKFLNPDQLKDHQCTLKDYKKTCCQGAFKDHDYGQGALKDHDYGRDKWQLPTPETRRYKCPDCDKRFEKFDHLAKHEQSNHTENKYICSDCGKAFKLTRGLITHAKVHGKVFQDSVTKQLWPFPCRTCERKFKVSEELEKHEKGHLNAKKYPCSYCKEVFRSSPSYDTHLEKAHADEKPFSCKKCDKRFRTKSEKRSDEYWHERPFRCNQCNNYGAYSLLGLNKHQSHQRKVNQNGATECSICEGYLCGGCEKMPPVSHSTGKDHEKTHQSRQQHEQQSIADQMSVRDQDVDDENTGLVSEIKTEMMDIDDGSKTNDGKFGDIQEFLKEIKSEPE